MRLFLIFLTSLFYTMAYTQQEMPPTNTAHKKALNALAAMAGGWEGDGWMYTPQREKATFRQTEKIQFKLDSTVLLIQGRGTSERKVVHDALGILSYDPEAGHYWMRSYLATGRSGQYEARLKDENLLEWEIPVPGGKILYVINLQEDDKWNEKGFMIMEDGQRFPFLEMNLVRK
ncbi:MAG: DUF1579 family protein [Phaeodactylibacter sp.]|nr:DUF1579 family protein [Phaeodactylibacter sp.]MCB9263544.1 DUF1579 family protein [Lewinellaceae bacterium]MCB9287579.1 DUF1579 family protein [Lewinellaceae bacterium]